jgi:hypothetical protein
MMKYTVEIVCISESKAAEVIHRVEIDELSVGRARAKALMVLRAWRNHGAKCARVLNRRNKKLYCLN